MFCSYTIRLCRARYLERFLKTSCHVVVDGTVVIERAQRVPIGFKSAWPKSTHIDSMKRIS